jgi:hypothetical protein
LASSSRSFSSWAMFEVLSHFSSSLNTLPISEALVALAR